MSRFSQSLILSVFSTLPLTASALDTCLGQICSISPPCTETKTYDNVFCVKEKWRIYVPRYSINHYDQLMSGAEPSYFSSDYEENRDLNSSTLPNTTPPSENAFDSGTR